jgi:glyoxylase-like metal-dependent hydrolase (beta-lactamase superfamily II)
MPVYHSLNQGIYCVDTAFMRDELASLYLLQEGDEVAFIDTGTRYSLDNVLTTLKALDIHHTQIKYVIPTHVHLDHAGGAGAMMELFDQARLIIHPRGAHHMIDPGKLIEGSISVYGEVLFRQLYGEIKPIDKARVDIAEDLDRYYLGSRELLFIDTPGHARHHFCIYDDQSQGIFTGDSFGLGYPPLKHLADGLIPTSSPVQFDPAALLATIDRLLSYQPKRMYLTHFGVIDQPAHRSIGLKRWITDYVALCEETNPLDARSEQRLQNKLRDMLFGRLSGDAGLSEDELEYLLENDIKLNSQGLAIWWRTTHRA